MTAPAGLRAHPKTPPVVWPAAAPDRCVARRSTCRGHAPSPRLAFGALATASLGPRFKNVLLVTVELTGSVEVRTVVVASKKEPV